MTRPPTRRRYLVASAAAVAAIAGCSDDSDNEEAPAAGEEEEEESGNTTESESAAPTEQEGGNETGSEGDDTVENIDYEEAEGSVSFVSPEDGDEVSSPVSVEMEVEGFELRPVGDAASPEQGVGHLHVIVDQGCLDPGYVIPQEDGYHHLSEGGREIELDLEPGEHDLCAQTGDAQHNAYEMTDEITIEVTEGGGGGNESNNSSEGLENEENGTNLDDEQ